MTALHSFAVKEQVKVGEDVYVFRLGCSCDCSSLAVATSEHDLCILDPNNLKPTRRLQGHRDVVEDLGFFQADPSCLVSCSHDGSAMVWDLRASTAARSFEVSSREVYSCCVGQDDSLLACAASNKVHLFDMAHGKQLRVFKESHTDVVNHVRFHPDGKLLSGAEDNLVVVLDTQKSREDEAMIGVIPNDECVRSFSLVGPDRNTLCCCSTTEDVRIWQLGEDFGTLKAQFTNLRSHPLLMRNEDEDFGLGYVVETFYDQPSAEVFLLAGAGTLGDLLLFRVTLAEAVPVAVFGKGLDQGHTGIVRSALCLPGGRVLTAGEDGRVCAWAEAIEDLEGANFGLEPTVYGAVRGAAGARASPY